MLKLLSLSCASRATFSIIFFFFVFRLSVLHPPEINFVEDSDVGIQFLSASKD